MAILDYFLSAFKGTPQAIAAQRNVLAKKPDIISGVTELQKICPPDEKNDNENPVFIFSAGWRSGSTLLQRLVMSKAEILIWGEPYDYCGLIQALADTTRSFTGDWPPEDYYYSHYNGAKPEKLTGHFIANLFPPPDDFRRGQRALFDRMFAEPAKRLGIKRWGIKEVRLGIEHALYLRWLYPKASFLFLYRNPLDAYRSYCGYGHSWYKTWPDEPVFTPAAFGAHWSNLVEGFIRDSHKVGGLVIRYEDLITGLPVHQLEEYLDIKVDPSILKEKIGGFGPPREKVKISALEKWMLKRATGHIAEEQGYVW